MGHPARVDAPPVERAHVRVVIVDDSDDIRLMLRFMLGSDPRFEVVGEGGDGRAAIALAGELQPDLVVLDREMPVIGGIEAISRIRRAAPRTEIVLYTAGADAAIEGLALQAGAIGLLDKQPQTHGVGESLARILARRWSDPGADLEVQIGPVASAAARSWVANTTGILAAVRAHPEVVWPAICGPVPGEVLDLFDRLLASWGAMAADTDTFLWVGRMAPEQTRTLVEEWARLDSMGDETLAAIGSAWSVGEGAEFFRALTQGVVGALAHHDQTRRLAERLVDRGWQPPAP